MGLQSCAFAALANLIPGMLPDVVARTLASPYYRVESVSLPRSGVAAM